MSSWRSFSKKHIPWHDLPAEFQNVKGPADPPHAEYSNLVEIQDMVDAFISPEMQRTHYIMLLAEKLTIARQLEPAHREWEIWNLWLDLIGLQVCIILTAIIFADNAIYTQSSSSLCRYKERFRNLSSDFSARLSDLYAIYAQVQVLSW